MDIEDLRRELTTSGTPTRTAIRELARMGARDAITTAGDPTRGAVRALVQRGVADALGYFGQREGQGEVMFVLAGCVRVPIGPATREWCDTLRAVAGDKPANVVAVPGDAWDEMPVLGDI